MNETSAAPRGGDARFVIVAALDHSDRDRSVLSAALSLALSAPGSGLHLAHVVEPGPPGPLPLGTASRIPTTLSIVENAEHFLAARAKEAAAKLKRPAFAHLLEGSAWRELIQLGIDVGAGVLVVGTHDRHGLSRLVLGSVAQEIVRAAPFSVLVARATPPTLGDDFRPACVRCRALHDVRDGAALWCGEHAPEHPMSRAYGSSAVAPG